MRIQKTLSDNLRYTWKNTILRFRIQSMHGYVNHSPLTVEVSRTPVATCRCGGHVTASTKTPPLWAKHYAQPFILLLLDPPLRVR